MATKQKAAMVPVSERALIQRINRKIEEEGEVLRVNRAWNGETEIGRYYTVDIHNTVVRRQHIELEGMGRECGVLKPYEKLAEGE